MALNSQGFWGDEMRCMRCLAQCLVQNKCSTNALLLDAGVRHAFHEDENEPYSSGEQLASVHNFKL